MNDLERAIQCAAAGQWGHPSQRGRGVIPVYWMDAARKIFCKYTTSDIGVFCWHWYDCRRIPKGIKTLIRGIDHLNELRRSACLN